MIRKGLVVLGVALCGSLGASEASAAGGLVATASAASGGQLYGFGSNLYGQLGSATNNGTGNPNPTPALVSPPGATGPVVQAAAGGDYGLAVTSTGQLYAFGSNLYGELGSATNSGTSNPNPTPALVSLPGATGPVVQAAAGQDHSLAVTSTGQLYAFGWNFYGQLGNATNSGTSNPNPTPTLVSLPGATGPVVQAAAGHGHSLAVTSTGQLYAFGDNDFGELGSATNNGTTNPNPPALVSLPGATGPVVQAAAGQVQSLALTSTGQLYAFGYNYSGELGSATNNGTSNPNPTPTLVSLPGATGPVVRVAAGDEHSLAVTSTGQLYAFGDNLYGELGSATNSGTSNPNPTPTLVSLPGATSPVVQAVAGYGHSLALTSTGRLYAFGDNLYGELGSATNNGTDTPNPTPALVSVAGGAMIDAIASGPEATHTLVVVGQPAAAQLAVSTGSLPDGRVGSPYHASAQATGGTAPYQWSARGLPQGVQIDRSSGQIIGTPTAAGDYHPTLTVTDSNHITASRSVALAIGGVMTTKAKLTRLRVSPRTFARTGRRVRGRCVKATAKNRRKRGCRRTVKLRISYTLNHATSVRFTLKRLTTGRKVKGGCVKPTAKNKKRKRCTRMVKVTGSVTRSGTAGAESFTFNGKLAGHKLAAGSYQLTATPTAGVSQTTKFTLTR